MVSIWYFFNLRELCEITFAHILSHWDRGGVHPNFFVSLTDENEQMFDPDFFWFFVFNIKAREEQPLEKRFDETIFFLPQKKSNLWRLDFEISNWLEEFHERFIAIFSVTFFSQNFSNLTREIVTGK